MQGTQCVSIEHLDPKTAHYKDIVNAVASIHLETFKGFFLTFLGEGFLRALYSGFCEHVDSGLIVASENDSVVGFLAYSNDLSGFYKWLIKRKLVIFLWYSFCAFLKNPAALTRLVRAFLKPSESKREEEYVELSSIGVKPTLMNRKIGSRLITALKKNFDRDRFAYIKLETDAEKNDAANTFYIRNGFCLDHSFTTHEGRKMNEYRWK